MPIDLGQFKRKTEVKKPEKSVYKKKLYTEKKPKKTEKSKKPSLTERNMNKTQLLDELYSLGKEFKDNITISKLRATLEDFKLYSKRK